MRKLIKRELFAAMAMQGYCAGKIGEMDFQKVAELAVKQADALLEHLEKEKQTSRFSFVDGCRFCSQRFECDAPKEFCTRLNL